MPAKSRTKPASPPGPNTAKILLRISPEAARSLFDLAHERKTTQADLLRSVIYQELAASGKKT